MWLPGFNQNRRAIRQVMFPLADAKGCILSGQFEDEVVMPVDMAAQGRIHIHQTNTAKITIEKCQRQRHIRETSGTDSSRGP